jgi:tetratricopeptide (TPR) repeat protein
LNERPAGTTVESGTAGTRWLLTALHAVCPLLFFTDLTRNPYFTQISLLQGGLCLALVLLVASAFHSGEWRWRRTPLDLPLGAFAAVALVSWGVSAWAHAPFRLSIWNEGRRAALFLLVNGLWVYGLAARLSGSAEWRARIRAVILAVGAVAAGYGVLQYLGREFIWPSTLNPYSGRPVSTFGNPNFLSSYLIMLLPVALQEALTSARAGRRWLNGGLFLLLGAGVVCTMTRSSWIGGIVAVGLAGWLLRREAARRARWFGMLTAALLALALFWPSSPFDTQRHRPLTRLTELARGVGGDRPYGSWHQRLLIWSCAWDMARERPVLGKGWGCFELFYPFYQGWYLADRTFRQFRTHANNAHNVVLEVWSQTGFAGMGVFLWIAAVALWAVRRRAPPLPDDVRPEAWALFAGVCGMMADNFFGNVSLFFAVPALLFWWNLGTLMGMLSPDGARSVPWRGAAVALGAAAVIAASAGIVHAYRQWRAEVFYFEGFKKAKSGDSREAVRLTELSHAQRRWEVNNNYEMGNAYARQARWSAENGLTQESMRLAEKAVWAYDEALSANAGYDEIYFNRAALLTQLGRAEEAVLNYRVSLLINPTSLEAYKALGTVSLAKPGGEAKAAELFERAVFYFPRDKDFWNNLGYCLIKTDRAREAVDAYARAVGLDLSFELAGRNLRISLGKAGIADHPLLRAPAAWETAVRAAGQSRWGDCRRAAEETVRLAPEFVPARRLLARALLETGDAEEARREAGRALDLEPESRETAELVERIDAAGAPPARQAAPFTAPGR